MIARTLIVEGAVGMVEMALGQLSAKNVVTLDEERKAQMVSNLLVVLCSEHETQPVVNAGDVVPVAAADGGAGPMGLVPPRMAERASRSCSAWTPRVMRPCNAGPRTISAR